MTALVEFLCPFLPFKFLHQNHPIMEYELSDVANVIDTVLCSDTPAVQQAFEQLRFVCSLEKNTITGHNMPMQQLFADILILKAQAQEFRDLVNEYRYMSPVKTEMKNYIRHIISTEPSTVYSAIKYQLESEIDMAITRRMSNG